MKNWGRPREGFKFHGFEIIFLKVVKVLQKGQIVIPKEYRKTVWLDVGKTVIVEKIDHAIVLVTESKEPLEAMKGLFKGLVKKPAAEAVRGLRREWERRLRREAHK